MGDNQKPNEFKRRQRANSRTKYAAAEGNYNI